MTIIERIDSMLNTDEYYNRPYTRQARTKLETFGFVKDMQGAVLVKTASGKLGFKPKTEEEMTI